MAEVFEHCHRPMNRQQADDRISEEKPFLTCYIPSLDINTRSGFCREDALQEPGVIGLASELVTTGPEYVGLATYLLGRVLVVDHIDNAIAIARKYRHSLRMVTVEGESFQSGRFYVRRFF